MKRVLVLVVLLAGIGLRWYALDWSLPYIFHPDETRLLYAVNDISPENLNPHFFAYGSLPIYLLKIVHSTAGMVTKRLGAAPPNFFLVGRILSSLFGSITLLALYGLGRRFFSDRVGILSAAFLAVTVLHIQLSHFLTVDVMLTCWVVLTLYVLAALTTNRHPLRDALLTGGLIGLALATKISALPLYGVLLAALLLRRFAKKSPSPRTRPISSWSLAAVTVVMSGLVFLLCEPYALLDYKEFLRQITEQSNMVRGLSQPPYVIQYEGTVPYLYPLKQLVLYAMGLPLGLLAVAGTIGVLLGTLKQWWKRPLQSSRASSQRVIALMFAWLIPVGWIVGGFQVKFLRYLLPMIPCFCLGGAIFTDQLLRKFPSWKRLIWCCVVGVLLFSTAYSLAFVSVYRHEDPRIQASRWIYAHLPEGKTILTELWEFAPIVAVDGHHPGQYRVEHLDLYAPDTDAKIERLAQQLSEADVIVLATRRLYGSILRVPERFPLTTNYYKLLFDGMLGFTPLAPFTNYPALFELSFNDDLADESFSVYDHPKTIVFKKTRQMLARELASRILAAPPVENSDALLKRLLLFPAQESSSSRLLSREKPEQETAQAEEHVAPAGVGRPQWQTALLWLLAVELLGLLAAPLTCLAFQKLPDAGYGLAKVVGLLLPAYLVWLLTSLNVWPYSRQSILIAIALLALGSLMVVVSRFPEWISLLRARWRIFLISEMVFLLAFEAFLLFRAYNPDIFWSESSMDFSFLTALTRGQTLPPPDPWMSGFPLNYYYFGHYLVATLTKLTGILPQIAYNLAFALFPALVIVEIFSLLYNLTRRCLSGAIGVIFSCILGNLDGFFLLVDRWRGREQYYRFFRPAHEIIPYTVHEFPFWTFIFVDLHAHLLNMPFLIATLLLGFHLLLDEQHESRLALALEALLSCLVLGTLGVISSWDYPTGVIFLLLLAAIKTYRHRSHRGYSWKTALRPLGCVFGLIPASLLLYLPFYSSFSRSGMGLGFSGDSITQLSDFLTIFGLFLFLILSALIIQSRRTNLPWCAIVALLSTIGFLYLLALYAMQRNYATLAFSLVLILFSGALLLPSKQGHIQTEGPPPERLFIWACLVYACLIVTGCELIFVRDFLQGGEYKRMNTIFKFYIPVWFFLAIAATMSLEQLVSWLRRTRRTASSHPLARSALKTVWLLCFLTLGLWALVFPVMGVYARRHQQDVYPRSYLQPTLDGLAYIAVNNPSEYEAIRWLNEHVSGTPVLLEATGADYLYEYARISANTGLPTVLGWRSHADQREHWQHTGQRARAVQEIYSSIHIERVLLLLHTYHVRYIYVGATERRDFADYELRKFQQYPEYFTPVFQSGETTIYYVHDPA